MLARRASDDRSFSVILRKARDLFYSRREGLWEEITKRGGAAAQKAFRHRPSLARSVSCEVNGRLSGGAKPEQRFSISTLTIKNKHFKIDAVLNHRDTMPVVCAASPMDQHASCKPSENSASGGILIMDKGHLSAFSPSSPAVIFCKGCFVS